MGANAGCCYVESQQTKFSEYCFSNASPHFQPFLSDVLREKSLMKDAIMGEWESEQEKTGKGIIYSHDRFYYEGDIVHSKASGEGKIIWPDKIIYRGRVADNKANGEGTLIFDGESTSIKGKWVDGEPALNQKMSLNKNEQQLSITIYEMRRQKEGDVLTAMIEFEGGLVYEGEVRSKSNREYRIEGKGKLTFNDGSRYTGQFQEGKMHGKGEYKWGKTGHWYEGEYVNNLRHGRGRYYYSAQQFKEGEWVGGQLQSSSISQKST